MRKITDLCTKSLVSAAVLLCAFLFAGCEGPLSNEELGLSLLNSKSSSGLGLLEDKEEGSGTSSQAKALVGTWLEVVKSSGYDEEWYIGGFIFNDDGTYYSLDEGYDSKGNAPGDRNIPIGPIADSGPTDAQLQILVSAVKAEPTLDTWSVSGNVITATDTWVAKSGEVEKNTDRGMYVLNGNTLMIYPEAEDSPYGVDENGDGWEDEPEWILTKYNF
ncbi:MAG: hypothetical protein K5778_00880 [Bacteroidaceae bacterium]|nr:hypothetical protein [Bacteroidaceae bacterium]